MVVCLCDRNDFGDGINEKKMNEKELEYGAFFFDFHEDAEQKIKTEI